MTTDDDPTIREVRRLEVVKHQPDPEMVSAIERLLDDAKSGKIVGLAFASEMSHGGIATMISQGKGGNIWVLIGATQELTKRLLDATSETHSEKGR